jgi:hypothetical protein
MLYKRESERREVRRVHSGSPGLRPQWMTASGAHPVVQGRIDQGQQPDVRSIWHPDSQGPAPTRVLPSPAGDRDDARNTELLSYQPQGRTERSIEYPPAETDPSPAYGWGQLESAGQQADSDRQSVNEWRAPPTGGRGWDEPSEPRREARAPGPQLAQTRLDGARPGEMARDGVYQPEHGREKVRSEHDALAEMGDESAAARSDSNGIPLSWDDD